MSLQFTLSKYTQSQFERQIDLLERRLSWIFVLVNRATHYRRKFNGKLYIFDKQSHRNERTR